MDDQKDGAHQEDAIDNTDLAQIFNTYYQPLYRYMLYHVRHQETAENLAGEVFVRFIEKTAAGDGPQQHLRGWLYRVAHNLVIDDARRHVHRDHEPLDEAMLIIEHDIENQAQMAIMKKHAWDALGKLTVKQRDVIVLKYLQGLENEEIARILGLSIGTVKARQHRGLASMRRYLMRLGVITEQSI